MADPPVAAPSTQGDANTVQAPNPPGPLPTSTRLPQISGVEWQLQDRLEAPRRDYGW